MRKPTLACEIIYKLSDLRCPKQRSTPPSGVVYLPLEWVERVNDPKWHRKGMDSSAVSHKFCTYLLAVLNDENLHWYWIHLDLIISIMSISFMSKVKVAEQVRPHSSFMPLPTPIFMPKSTTVFLSHAIPTETALKFHIPCHSPAKSAHLLNFLSA